MSTSNQLRCPTLVANSAGPATSTSAEQPAASPPLLPSITNSFLSSFPPSFLSRILSLSVLPAYSPYARARSGNYGNSSNGDGHAQQQFLRLNERKTRAPGTSGLKSTSRPWGRVNSKVTMLAEQMLVGVALS